MEKSAFDRVIVRVPADPVIMKGLQRKLEEYQERVAETKRTFNIPDGQFTFTGDEYKLRLLSTLLEKGEVTARAIMTNEAEQEALFQEGPLREMSYAINVIKDYCATGGRNLNYLNGEDVLNGIADHRLVFENGGAESPMHAYAAE